uniref:Protein O-glucosyltransferase 2 n=1 Tax=Neogobius melanostomus TaxID=47308 RepID=A0A8C6WZS2_9GOBI
FTNKTGMVCFFFPGALGGSSPSAAKTLVWGPGLEPNVVLPARFFYIQAVDTKGSNFTTSPGEKAFEVNIVSPTEQFTRIWVQVLDRQDGSFVVRYRMYSPYILRGPVYHEGCNCPQPSGDLWEKHMKCPGSFAQIDKDLSVFNSLDPDLISTEVPVRFGQRQSLCHYTIKNNKVFIPNEIYINGYVLLPDIEFFVNLGDWPLEKRKSTDKIHPILSWCGSNNTRDIVMPTYDLTESVLETMGRVSLDMMSVQANTGPPWHQKNFSAFWRGRDSRQERLELVKLSRAHPQMLDAAFTNFFFFKHDESLYGPLVKHVSFFDFFKYKYQINIDGTVAAYRMPYLLAGDSVVLKQDSGYYEHFYSQLQPWEHYIPIRADLGDLLEKIQWAKDHDEEARRISQKGQQFARNHLMGDMVFCYYYKLFQKYAELQVTEPKVREGMELVEQPTDDLFPCYCQRTGSNTARDEL